MRNTTVDLDTDQLTFSTSSLQKRDISAYLLGDEDGPTAGFSFASERRLQPKRALTRWQSHLGRSLMIAGMFAVTTARIVVQDANYELSRSGAWSLEWTRPSKKGRRVSLREACRLAQQILADTERAIEEDDLAEARLSAFIWENDDLP